MTSPDMRRRTGAHRTSRGVVSALVPSALAVLAVAALITSLAVWRGQGPAQPPAAASTDASTAAREAISKAASSTASGSREPAKAATTEKAATTPPAPAATTAPDDRSVDPQEVGVAVVVLNQTTRAGLAGRVAASLRDEGWTVPAVGNFRGTVPATTVYYPDGQEAAAQALAESLPTAPRTRPRFGNLSTTRLTVVVTADYPG